MIQYYKSRIPSHATKVFSGVIYDVYHWDQELYNGSTTTFEMVKQLDAVSVLAIRGDKIVTIYEEQPLREPYWAMPGGYMDRGEVSPQDAAVRELYEETGMNFATMKLVAVDFIGGTRQEGYIYRFVASDFINQTAPRPEAGERITVNEFDLDRVKEISKTSLYTPQEILQTVSSIDDILALPEIQPLH